MFTQLKRALPLLLAANIALTAQPTANAANGAPAVAPLSKEANQALARLGELTLANIRERLQRLRQPGYQPSPYLINKIIEAQRLPVEKSARVDQLRATLQPVLDYHQRSQTPIYVLRSEQARAYMVEGIVIFLTTRLILNASDTELRGIVAHELAHQLVFEERQRAFNAKDGKLMWECELFCDAVAAFTLKELQDSPATYARALERLATIGAVNGNDSRTGALTHPPLEVRLKLNQFLCQLL